MSIPEPCPGCGMKHMRRDFGPETCQCCSHRNTDHGEDGCEYGFCNCVWPRGREET